MNFFTKLKATLQLREAIRLADNAHQQSGNRFYVMPNGISSGKLIVMDRDNFRKLKQKGYIAQRAHIHDLLRDAFYYTPDRNETGILDDREETYRKEQYFKWIQHCAELNKLYKAAKKKRGR